MLFVFLNPLNIASQLVSGPLNTVALSNLPWSCSSFLYNKHMKTYSLCTVCNSAVCNLNASLASAASVLLVAMALPFTEFDHRQKWHRKNSVQAAATDGALNSSASESREKKMRKKIYANESCNLAIYPFCKLYFLWPLLAYMSIFVLQIIRYSCWFG